jgi:hypothetical protein
MIFCTLADGSDSACPLGAKWVNRSSCARPANAAAINRNSRLGRMREV